MKDKKLVPKAYRRLAEVAAEHYAYKVLGCVRTVRAVKTQFQRQDMFASDILGRRHDGTLCAIQVTSGQDDCVTKRKRKLEKEIWHSSDTVLLLRLYWEKSTKNKRSKLWYFKVWHYASGSLQEERYWHYNYKEDHAVPKEWFKLYNKEIVE